MMPGFKGGVRELGFVTSRAKTVVLRFENGGFILVQAFVLVQCSTDRNNAKGVLQRVCLCVKKEEVLPFYSSRTRLYNEDLYSSGGSLVGGPWVA